MLDVVDTKTLVGPNTSKLKGKSTKKRSRGYTVKQVLVSSDFHKLNRFVIAKSLRKVIFLYYLGIEIISTTTKKSEGDTERKIKRYLQQVPL